MHTSMNVSRIRVLLLVIGVMGLVSCKRMKPVAVKFNKFTSTFNPKYLEYLNAVTTPGSNGRMLDVNTTLKTDISSGLHSRLDLLVKSRAGLGGYKTIFSYNVDMCKFYEGSVNLPLVKTWLKNIVKFSNMPTACPIKSGYFYVKSFQVDPRSVPLFIMEGHYMLIITPYIRNEQNMVANLTVEVGISK